MNKSLTLLAAGSFALVLFTLLFSYEIVLLVFSESYLEVQPTFVLLMLSIGLGLLANIMGYSLVSAGYPERSTKVNLMVIFVELLLAFALIPFMGYSGAAAAYTLATAFAQCLCYFYLHKAQVHINLANYLKPFLFLTLAAALYWLIDSNSFIIRGTLLLVYVALCFFFIYDCRHAVTVLWQFTRRVDKQTKPA